MTPDKELAYQARIRELVEACKEEHIGMLDGNNNECPICNVLSRPDDLSALDAYVLEEKRKVLREATKEFGEDACIQDGTNVATTLRDILN